MTTQFKDHFSGHADDYAKYRPSYPPELFNYIRSLVPEPEHVWDCGTGNGQAARGLAEFAKKVTASDPSEKQIAAAKPHAGVEFIVAPAENVPLPDGSVDLITVAQALHWFDFHRFNAEVKRVGRPGAILAAWSYALNDMPTPESMELLRHYYEEIVGPYWPPERMHVEHGYRDIPFPFEPVHAPEIQIKIDMPVEGLLGYLATWSATRRYQADKGIDPLEQIIEPMKKAWGEPGSVHTIRWPIILKVGRV